MREVFLSAGVPEDGPYAQTVVAGLVSNAVRELLIHVTSSVDLQFVWGGQPAITPMVWEICASNGRDCLDRMKLYQSRYYEGQYPEEVAYFDDVQYLPDEGTLNDSLQTLRRAMFARPQLEFGVFVGGAEGIVDEYNLFTQRFGRKSLVLTAAGGATLELAQSGTEVSETTDFGGLFRREISADYIRPPTRPKHDA